MIKNFFVPVVVVVGIVGFAVLISLAAKHDADAKAEWERFKLARNCKLVSQIDGSSFSTVGVSSSGKMVIGTGSVSAKECWLCDDNMTYCKDKP